MEVMRVLEIGRAATLGSALRTHLQRALVDAAETLLGYVAANAVGEGRVALDEVDAGCVVAQQVGGDAANAGADV